MKKKLFIGVYNPSIILTYISVFCSIFGIAHLMKSETILSFDYMRVAIPLLIVAGVCDMFDGTVARMCKRTEVEKNFGIQLDSLADTVSFVVFPACMLVHMANYTIASMIIACFYVFAGIMRLGWFNVTTDTNKGFFQGLPVTLSAVIIPVVYVILEALKVSDSLFAIIMHIVFAIIGILFILNFRLNKPDTKAKIALGILAVAMIVLLFFI
jgi:CDP-diacylglycerol--serine O-phosphatidyltransferase